MKTLALLVAIAATGVARAQAIPAGSVVAASAVDPNHIYREFEVEVPVRTITNSPRPVYPPELKKRGVEGEVQARFVVDTIGRADTLSVVIVKATDDAFASSVKAVIPKLRFDPAQAKGHKVKQLVTQRFLFPAQQ
jgi:TonB family protein